MGKRITPQSHADWELIERQYRAGQLSVRAIAEASGITDTAIRKKAKQLGWQRDLSGKVQDEVRTQLVRREVRREVRSPEQTARTEREIVEEAAAVTVLVVREHRQSIQNGRGIVGKLLGELEHSTDEIDTIEALIEGETADDNNGARRNLMIKAVSLHSRSQVAVNLTNALKNLVGIEREAFGIDNKPPDADSYEARLRKIHESA